MNKKTMSLDESEFVLDTQQLEMKSEIHISYDNCFTETFVSPLTREEFIAELRKEEKFLTLFTADESKSYALVNASLIQYIVVDNYEDPYPPKIKDGIFD